MDNVENASGNTNTANTACRTVSYSYHKNSSLATRTWQRDANDFSLTATGAGAFKEAAQ